MNVIIIEDEPAAAKRLSNLIKKYDDSVEIIAILPSVKKSVEWFKTNEDPDLAFFDIQLADGLSFQIFEEAIVNCPIIFTTAYDEYAVKAFKVNSVDYLLKPIDYAELYNSIQKFKRTHQKESVRSSLKENQINELLKLIEKPYKERFVVKVGTHIKLIDSNVILFFYSFEKATYIFTSKRRNYVITHSLDQLEALLNPQIFFRINRKYIININAVEDIISFSSNRLKLKIINSDKDDFIVSREKVNTFKNWLE